MEKAKIKSIRNKAFEFDKNYGGCTQAVLYAFKEEFDFVSDELFRAGTGLSGGVGLSGKSCGALLGGAIIISTVLGRNYNDLENKEIRYKTLRVVRKLVEKFEEKYKVTSCNGIQRELLGKQFDLWIPEEKKLFEEKVRKNHTCPKICRNSAGWTAEILSEQNLI